MTRIHTATKTVGLTLAIALIAAAGYYAQRLAGLGSGFSAKYLCSEVFVAERPAEAVARDDLPAFRSPILDLVDWRLDRSAQSVSADILGIGRRRAIYRAGLGCTLVFDAPPAGVPVDPESIQSAPDGDFPQQAPAPAALGAVIEQAFAEPDIEHPRRTRALLVIQDGKTLVERYAPGFSKRSRFRGWSMSKSLVSALIGELVERGRLRPEAPAPVREWSGDGDPRQAITLEHMLHMSTGLAFDEDADNPLSDLIWMLYGTGDSAAFVAGRPLIQRPGLRFQYASGVTVLLSRILTEVTDTAYPAFARDALFGPLGMTRTLIEPDAAGTPLGSSEVWATARAWARFGLLYLNDGVWRGRRLLPEGWVDFGRTPAPAAEGARYGGHFWLKVPPPYRLEPGRPQLLPADAYHAVGHGGQFVTIVPSLRLVVVRLGLALDPGAWDHEAFIRDLVAALDSGRHHGDEIPTPAPDAPAVYR